MKEKGPVYDEEGRVSDPELAREAADIEAKGHKKYWGIFKHTPDEIEAYERAGEIAIEKGTALPEKKFWGIFKELNMEALPSCVRNEIKRLEKEEEIEINNGTMADLGRGVMRYRFYGSASDGFRVASAGVFAAGRSASKDIQVIMDVRGDALISSKVVEDLNI